MTLDLRTPDVVSARSLRVAVDRAMPPRSGLRTRFAAAHGLSAADVSRAARDTYRDARPLARLAAVVGYEPHPTRPGFYRRIAVNLMEA